MTGINKVILIGHLGKDPELRYLDDQTAVTSFPLVTTELLIKNGMESVHTEWHNVVMWRSIAERACEALKKGELVCIEGRMKTRSYEDKSGMSKRVTEIVAAHFRRLGNYADNNPLPDQLEA